MGSFSNILLNFKIHLQADNQYKIRRRKVKKKLSEEARPKTKKVQFNLFAPEAKRVFLVGGFNNWDVDNLLMKRIRKEPGRLTSPYHQEDMNIVSELMESGMMTQMPMKGLKPSIGGGFTIAIYHLFFDHRKGFDLILI